MSINTIPDLQARQSALDITQSFLVQAPAGSGKTELLTQRFLKLLAYVETPEEIIAITFTNKAAAEMRSRIIAALEKAEVLPEPEREHEKATWILAKIVLKYSQDKNWHLREHPNRLRILTMDALSLKIAQQMPISSKLGAQLDIADDPNALYQQAAKMILLASPIDSPWIEEIKTLLLYLDNHYAKLEALLVNLLAKRDQWLPLMMLGNDVAAKRTLLENELEHVNNFALQKGKNILPGILEKEIEALTIYASATIPWPNADIKEHWLCISNMLLTQADQLRKKSDKNIGFPSASSSKSKPEKALFEEYKQRYQQLVNALEGYPDFTEWLIEIRNLPNINYTDTQWEVLSALLTLLPLCAAQLRLIFSQTGQIDYIENSQSALYALGDSDNPTDISLSLDHKIRHLLVDEFQDTSNNQFQLLEKLTAGWMSNDGRTLFLVGDPMQSIYRFRQAEVGLFLHAKHHGIGSVALDFITLSSNFRSTAQIVNWTNEKFNAIFPKNENIQLGAIPYSMAHAIHTEEENSHVECLYFSKENILAEENYILEKIKTIRAESPEATIAILIRSRNHLKSITPLLQAAHVAYQAVDIEALSHKPIIHDLLSLTRACLHLGDRVAWLACLRAPWCGLTLNDLWIIAHGAKEQPIWALLQDENIISQLNDDAQARVLHFRQAMTLSIQQRQRISLRDIVENTWKCLGGETLLIDDNQQRDTTQFFEILDQIKDSMGILQFEKIEKKVNALFAATQATQYNPVQIMTIHKAKGLEFDHVFLPKLHKKPAPSDQPLITWLEYPDGDNIHHLLMAPMSDIKSNDATYNYIQKQQQRKLSFEIDRILYVAVTRAKKCLYLTATLDLDKAPSTQSLLGRAWQAFMHDHQKIEQDVEQLLEPKALEHPPALLTRMTLYDVKQCLTPSKTAYLAEQKNAPELIFSEHREEAKIGVIIHLIIERIAENGTVWWQVLNATQQKAIIHALGQQFNLLSPHEKIHRAIDNLMQDPRGQWILKKRAFAFNEYILFDKPSQQWEKKILDRVFQDDDGQYWIIDFKTSENNDPMLSNDVFIQQAAERHYPQLQSYQQALSHALNVKNIQLALYFPLLPAWMVYSN